MKGAIISSFFTILVLFVFTATSSAQDSEHDSTTRINSAYIGILGTTDFYEDRVEKDASFRIGGGASWFPWKNIALNSWAFLDYNGGSTTENMMFGISYKPSQELALFAGHIPTVSATIRPIPVSAQGHFEFWTTDKLPGLAPGVSMQFSVPGFLTGLGVSYRFQHSEIHGRISVLNTSIVGYYNTDKKHWGIGGEHSNKVFTIQGIINESLYGSALAVTISEKLQLLAYGVAGIDRNTDGWLKKEIGFAKSMQKGPFQGILGAGYDFDLKAVRTYVLVSL